MSKGNATDVWAEYDKRNAGMEATGKLLARIRSKDRARMTREIDRLDAEVLSLRFDNGMMRGHLRDALDVLGRDECDTCRGSGGVEVFAGPTPMDERVVGWTDPAEESCDDCMGCGRKLV